jgi:hypothetical protein
VLARIEALLNSLYTLTKRELLIQCKELVPEYSSSSLIVFEHPDQKGLTEKENETTEKLFSHRFKV